MNNIKNALAFYVKYPGWQGYAKNRATERAIKSLVKSEHLEINEYHQAKFTGKTSG